MQENTELHLKGTLTMVLQKENGDVETFQKDNIIVNGGFDFICDAIANASRGAVMGYIGIGDSSTAAAATQTDLQAATNKVRKAATYAHTAGTKVFTLSTTFGAGTGTFGITEAGVFNAASAGTMLDRVVFSVINKGANDVLTSTFTFTLS